MIRKLVMLGLVMSMMSVSSLALAEDVFKTKRGKKYHTNICKLIKHKDALQPIDKEEALEAGLEPCKRCFKEDVVVNEHPDKE